MLLPIFPFLLSLHSLPSIYPFILFSPSIHPIMQRKRYGRQTVSRHHFFITLPDNDMPYFSKTIRFSELIQPIITRITVDLHIHILFVPVCHPMVTLPFWGVVLIYSRCIDFYFIHIVCFYPSDHIDRNHCIIYTVLSFTLIVASLRISQSSFLKLSYIIVLVLLRNPLESIEEIIYLSKYPIIRYWSYQQCL